MIRLERSRPLKTLTVVVVTVGLVTVQLRDNPRYTGPEYLVLSTDTLWTPHETLPPWGLQLWLVIASVVVSSFDEERTVMGVTGPVAAIVSVPIGIHSSESLGE